MPPPRKHASNALKQAAYRSRRAAAQEEQLRAKGLPPLPVLATMPGHARWRSAIESACALLEQTTIEMRDYYADRSERWQDTERAEGLMEQMTALESVLDELRTLTE